jgi:hypothetical protein
MLDELKFFDTNCVEFRIAVDPRDEGSKRLFKVSWDQPTEYMSQTLGMSDASDEGRCVHVPKIRFDTSDGHMIVPECLSIEGTLYHNKLNCMTTFIPNIAAFLQHHATEKTLGGRSSLEMKEYAVNVVSKKTEKRQASPHDEEPVWKKNCVDEEKQCQERLRYLREHFDKNEIDEDQYKLLRDRCVTKLEKLLA